MSDFNAHLHGNAFIKPTDDCGGNLIDMMVSFNLVSKKSLPMCSGASASFVSYDDAYTSLIDHILLPVERIDTVISCKILDDPALMYLVTDRLYVALAFHWRILSMHQIHFHRKLNGINLILVFYSYIVLNS